MTKFIIPKPHLEAELFIRRNIFLARLVVLKALAGNDPIYKSEVLEHIRPENFERRSLEGSLFQKSVNMIRSQGQVDVQELRRGISSFAPDAPDFTEGCYANFDLMVSLDPTLEQVRRAIELMTSPPPPNPFLISKKSKDGEDLISDG